MHKILKRGKKKKTENKKVGANRFFVENETGEYKKYPHPKTTRAPRMVCTDRKSN